MEYKWPKQTGGSGGGTWGSITGTLSDQTDLQNALDAKANQSTTYTKTEVDNALNAKQATITGAATSIVSSNLTASRALVSDASGKVAVSSVTSTQLGYVSGVTSAIQTQLNSKLPTTITTTGDLIYSSSGTTASRLPIGSSNQVLTVSGGVPTWQTPAGVAITSNVIPVGTGTTVVDSGLSIVAGSGGYANTSLLRPTSGRELRLGPASATPSSGTNLSFGDSSVSIFVADGGSSNSFSIYDTYTYTSRGITAGSFTTSNKVQAGSLQVTGSSPTAGKVLTSDASGNATWQDPAGGLPSQTGNNGKFLLTNGTTASWAAIAGDWTVQSVSSNITMTSGTMYFVNTSAARTLTLPTASAGARIMIKDISGLANTNTITVARAGSESIEGVAGNKLLQTNWGAFTLVSDGTNWYMI